MGTLSKIDPVHMVQVAGVWRKIECVDVDECRTMCFSWEITLCLTQNFPLEMHFPTNTHETSVGNSDNNME